MVELIVRLSDLGESPVLQDLMVIGQNHILPHLQLYIYTWALHIHIHIQVNLHKHIHTLYMQRFFPQSCMAGTILQVLFPVGKMFFLIMQHGCHAKPLLRDFQASQSLMHLDRQLMMIRLQFNTKPLSNNNINYSTYNFT